MHDSALRTGELFFKTYANRRFGKILDIGGRDFNGSLRRYAPPAAKFTAIDLEAGQGVDIVLTDPNVYPFDDKHFDCIVSTSCLEHDRMFWLTVIEASRVLSDTGVMYLSVPSQGAYHGYPYDNWRFYPDASLAIVDWTERSGRPLRLIESFNHPDMPFNDYVMVFAKGTGPRQAPFLHPQIAGAYNIRTCENKDIINPKLETPAIEIISLLGKEIERLRAQVAKLTPGRPALAPTRAAE